MLFTSKKLKIQILIFWIFALLLPSTAYSSKNDPEIWNVQNTYEYYVGRTSLQKEISSKFRGSNREVTIVGSAGIGKTQLAKKYAEKFKHSYNIIWWLDVGKGLDAQYLKLAHEWNRINDNKAKQINTYLSQADIINQIKDRLRTTSLNWLLIFDNVTDKDQIKNYIPEKHNKTFGHILITSKNPYSWLNIMKLEKFTRSESIELVKKITNVNDTESANQLAEIMGDYPLAIAQAASYIKSSPGLNIKNYIQLFQTSRTKLWAEENKDQYLALDNYQFTIFTTLSLIAKEIKQESPEAFELLIFCSFLNSKTLPKPLLKRYAINQLKQDAVSFYKSLRILSKYSLIDLNKSNLTSQDDDETTFSIHELTQMTIQDMLNKNDKRNFLEKSLEISAEFISNKIDVFVPYFTKHNHIVVNLESIVDNAIKNEIYNNDILTIEQRMLEYNLSGKRDFIESQKLIDRIESLLSKVPNLSPLTNARFAIMKSSILSWLNIDMIASLQNAKYALEILNKIPKKGEEHLMAYIRLSALHHLAGDNDSSLIYATQGEELIQNDNELGNQDVFYQTFAKIYTDKGDFELAYKYAIKAISKLAHSYGKIMAGEIPAYFTKTTILLKMKKVTQALENSNKIMEVIEDNFGNNNHLIKATAYSHHGYTLFLHNNDTTKAKDFLLKGQKMFQEVLGDLSAKNKAFALSYQFTGEIYEKEGDNSRAQQEYAKALQIITNSYNGNPKAIDDFSEIYTRLAIINAKLNDPASAQHYLDLHITNFGYEHPRTMQITKYFIDNNMSVGF